LEQRANFDTVVGGGKKVIKRVRYTDTIGEEVEAGITESGEIAKDESEVSQDELAFKRRRLVSLRRVNRSTPSQGIPSILLTTQTLLTLGLEQIQATHQGL